MKHARLTREWTDCKAERLGRRAVSPLLDVVMTVVLEMFNWKSGIFYVNSDLESNAHKCDARGYAKLTKLSGNFR